MCNLGTVVRGVDPRCRLSGRERKTRPAFASATAVQILEARDAGLSAMLDHACELEDRDLTNAPA